MILIPVEAACIARERASTPAPSSKQAAVPVLDDDTEETLAARILKEEHLIYSEANALALSGRYRIDGRRVIAI